MAQTPLRGIKSLKSGSGWDDSMDGIVDEMEPHTPPKRLFGHDDDVDQEEDTGSFVEEDTVLGVPLRDGSGGKDGYREEDGFGEDEGVMLPKVLNFTTIRKGANSPDDNEDDQPLPNSATSATQLHPVTKSPRASAPSPKVDIPLERFVVNLAKFALFNQSDSPPRPNFGVVLEIYWSPATITMSERGLARECPQTLQRPCAQTCCVST